MTTPEPGEKPCPKCDGEGYAFVLVANRYGILSHVKEWCFVCHGTGVLWPGVEEQS